jgi:RNase P/RNase MRP subunit POP5
MVVKDKVGRKRYIVFEVDPPGSSRRDLIRELNRRSKGFGLDEPPKLTVFDGHHGIVACRHLEKERVIGLLQDIELIAGSSVSVRSLLTSGTIYKAKKFIERI